MNINFWGRLHGTRRLSPQLSAGRRAHRQHSSIFCLIAPPANRLLRFEFAVRGFSYSLRHS